MSWAYFGVILMFFFYLMYVKFVPIIKTIVTEFKGFCQGPSSQNEVVREIFLLCN